MEAQSSNKMEEDYNWDLIMKVSAPIALAVGIVFYLGIGNAWKWSAFAIGMFLAALLVYINDKRKSNIFTAVGIVLLVTLIVKFFRDSGFF